MSAVAAWLMGEAAPPEAEVAAICAAFECTPAEALAQPLELTRRVLELRDAAALMRTPEARMSPGQREWFEELKDTFGASSTRRLKFLARQRRLSGEG